MKKFALLFLTAAMTLSSGAVLAADSSSNNGTSNQAASAGAAAGGAKENLPPNNVDNSKLITLATIPILQRLAAPPAMVICLLTKWTRTPSVKMVNVRTSIKKFRLKWAAVT